MCFEVRSVNFTSMIVEFSEDNGLTFTIAANSAETENWSP